VREQVPNDIPVLAPTWLPEGVGAPQLDWLDGPPRVERWMFGIAYRFAGKSLLFGLNGVNSPPPTRTERVTVGSREAVLLYAGDGDRFLQLDWRESGQIYHLQSAGIARGDLLRVFADLRPQSR
jgi:hypothetical protein